MTSVQDLLGALRYKSSGASLLKQQPILESTVDWISLNKRANVRCIIEFHDLEFYNVGYNRSLRQLKM